jgi:hypothetical protein
MTVGELIAKLKKQDPNALVMFDDGAAENGDGFHVCVERVGVESHTAEVLSDFGVNVGEAAVDVDEAGNAYLDIVVLAGVR